MATALLAGSNAISEMILAADFEKIDFRAELDGGHLVLDGLLADQAAMDNIPVGIYVLEKDGTLVKCNKTAIAAWGRTPSLGTSEKHCGAYPSLSERRSHAP